MNGDLSARPKPDDSPAAKRKRKRQEILRYVNKQRLLLVGSRGVNARQRHLLEDLGRLLPHHKKESKLETKGELRVLNEIAELRSCNGCLYVEARRRGLDLYAWIARFPTGPSFKFRVLNLHTMDELRLTGNCAQGTRPLLCFDPKFDATPHWRLCKRALAVTFGTPRGHPKSKPFFDHALSFAMLDDKIWVRHFQISPQSDDLVEIGPRFVLSLLKILAGPFSGATLYNQPESKHVLVKPVRNYLDRKIAHIQRVEHKLANKPPPDELASLFKDTGQDPLAVT